MHSSRWCLAVSTWRSLKFVNNRQSFSRWCGIWNSKIRNRHRWTWYIQARAHHEGACMHVTMLARRLNHANQSLIPVVMSGIIAVYGLVVSVLISGSCTYPHMIVPVHTKSRLVTPHGYPLVAGFVHLGAGLACGFTGLTAGYAIGIVGDSVRFYHLGFPLLTILPTVRPRICT